MASKRDTRSQNLFKKTVSSMPEGYYSGDKPNPHLRAFVEQHLKEWPYDPTTDTYEVPAFDKAIDSTKSSALYNMHSYWSKKPYDAIRQYIRHYTQPEALILDPFSGSGSTALAAILDGRKAVAIDRSPAATFITRHYCTPVDAHNMRQAFDEIRRRVEPEIDWLYETRCDRCGGTAQTAFTVFSQVFQCPRCLDKLPLFDCVEVERATSSGKPKKVSVCPYCLQRGASEEINSRSEKYGSVPVLVSYLCKNKCRPRRAERCHNDSSKKKREFFERYDLSKLREIESRPVPKWYPTDRMMNSPANQVVWGSLYRPGVASWATVDEVFYKRNLWALAIIRSVVDIDSPMGFALSGTILNASRMYRHRESGGGGPAGSISIPQINREMNVWSLFETKVSDLLAGARELSSVQGSQVFISTQSATNLSNIPSSSIDYVFTDPPYSGKFPYGQLNFIWEAWLQLDTRWHQEEIIVDECVQKTEHDWAMLMLDAMRECFRVLKPGRWLSLCYHDTSEGTWELIQDIMAEVGFVVETSGAALYIDTGQKTIKQILADKVNKRDLVINFRKPRAGEVATEISFLDSEDPSTFSDRVRLIISDYLLDFPGAPKDRIFDEVVSRMVRAGQMEAHNFDEILRSVAEEVRTPVKKDLFRSEDLMLFGTHEVSRWFLKETELDLGDAAESKKEDEAAEKLESFIKVYLKKHQEKEGVHYSDLFEQYVYGVKEKPRRQLAEFLPDYFFKTEAGTWRPPATPEEAKAKAEGRIKGTGRRVKRYIALLEQGHSISASVRPNDASLAEWIRHCKRAGLYEQGKLLYEKGGINLDNLPEEAMVGVEEDYQVCVRMLARDEGVKAAKRRKGARE